MSVIEIKSDLHRLIDDVQDAAVLEAIHTILEKQSSWEKDFWLSLSNGQKMDIESGLTDLAASTQKTN